MKDQLEESTSAFYRFLEQALTLGARGVKKSALPRFVGFLVYAALIALLAAGLFLRGPKVTASAIVLLIVVALVGILLLHDVKIRPIVFEIIFVLVVVGFLGGVGYTMYKSLNPPSPVPVKNDPVKEASMKGSLVDCQNYAGRIRVKPSRRIAPAERHSHQLVP